MPVTKEELATYAVNLNWKVEEQHHTQMTLLEFLKSVDFYGETWTNEDGSIRFDTVEEAFEWAITREQEGGSGFLDDHRGEDWLLDMAASSTWVDSAVEGWDVDAELWSPAQLAEKARKDAEKAAEFHRVAAERRAKRGQEAEADPEGDA